MTLALCKPFCVATNFPPCKTIGAHLVHRYLTWLLPSGVAMVVAVGTHILARFYVQDPSDNGAGKQRPLARKVGTDALPVKRAA